MRLTTSRGIAPDPHLPASVTCPINMSDSDPKTLQEYLANCRTDGLPCFHGLSLLSLSTLSRLDTPPSLIIAEVSRDESGGDGVLIGGVACETPHPATSTEPRLRTGESPNLTSPFETLTQSAHRNYSTNRPSAWQNTLAHSL